MSKRSRERRRLETLKRKEQLALQSSVEMEENETIGELVNRLRTVSAPKKVADDNGHTHITIMESPKTELPTTEAWPADWPECPSSCDPFEWRRAMENRDYYLLCAMDDGNKKPWFQYPRFTYQYSEFVFITPAMAQELLKFNPLNRHIKHPHVEGLKRDIQNRRWLQTHESIAINKNGNMHDGQHRALAIDKAETGWPIYVTWNVPPEAIYATDSGDKRPINEKLSLLFPDLKMTQKTAALSRSMMWGLSNRGLRYTESEIAGFMLQHNKVINWVVSRTPKLRADLQAVLCKSMMWWGEAIMGSFVERMKTVQFTGEGDPAKSLYLWLQNAKQQGRRTAYVSPIIYYKKTLSAVHAHASGRDAKRIIAKEQDIFEWGPGWTVPPGAPCQGKIFIHEDEPDVQTPTE